MSTWNPRLFPYPLLAPWTDDYGGAEFQVHVPEVVLNNGLTINVDLEFHLSSRFLQGLISNEDAKYAIEVSCPKTFVRTTHETAAKDELALDAGDYTEEILVTPYVVSAIPMSAFKSPEHAPELREHKPEGFTVPVAGILAVGNPIGITLEEGGVTSVIDLVANPKIEDGSFDVQLDDERIKIHVGVKDKERIEALRRRRGTGSEFSALFPGLYLHAITEALRHLPEYEYTRWAFTFRNTLDKCGHGNVDSELLRNDALKYAQQLMERPMGGFLAAALSSDEEEL